MREPMWSVELPVETLEPEKENLEPVFAPNLSVKSVILSHSEKDIQARGQFRSSRNLSPSVCLHQSTQDVVHIHPMKQFYPQKTPHETELNHAIRITISNLDKLSNFVYVDLPHPHLTRPSPTHTQSYNPTPIRAKFHSNISTTQEEIAPNWGKKLAGGQFTISGTWQSDIKEDL